jgi:hypothetical protein
MKGVSKEARNSILANGGPDIGFTPRGYLERRRKALIAAAAAEVPRAEAAGDGPAKRPRLDTGLHNEPSTSHPFMAHQYPFAGQSSRVDGGHKRSQGRDFDLNRSPERDFDLNLPPGLE